MDGKVTIFYNDTPNTVSKKIGQITKQDDNYIYLDSGVRIPHSKVVRIEAGVVQ